MAGDSVPTIHINMDKACAECGKGGACENKLCMACTADAIGGKRMKSAEGKAVRDRTHNLRENQESPVAKSGFAKDQLKSFVHRIERLEEERAALGADIREVYSEAKGTGFCTKTMRRVIRLRKLDKADLQEQDAQEDMYRTALDMER